MGNFKRLFESVKLGKYAAKNRIVFAPTQMMNCDNDGNVTDQTLCHYVARVKGGTGIIIAQGTMTSNRYFNGIGAMGIYDERHSRGLHELATIIEKGGALGIIQLSVGLGAQVMRSLDDRKIVAPSPIQSRISSPPKALAMFNGATGEVPKELTKDEIKILEEDFVRGVERAKRVGFKGIEIHAPHGYLLGEFLSPYNNKRVDEYGGDFERRLTFAVNLIRGAREVGGDDFIIGLRMSGDEHIEGGYTLQDAINMAKRFEAEGINYLHISSGRTEALNMFFPEKEGVMLPEARAIKKHLSIPVICPNIHSPELAEEAVERGDTDLVSLSRALIVDPFWVEKVCNGKKPEKCIFCYTCVKNVFYGFLVKCSVNKEVGNERFIRNYSPV
jgi:2,4-dienoyl-CoA reductase-like NADH-dependent reductase (Old Yellow Enzyme family)